MGDRSSDNGGWLWHATSAPAKHGENSAHCDSSAEAALLAARKGSDTHVVLLLVLLLLGMVL